jgi:hypothetical protein
MLCNNIDGTLFNNSWMVASHGYDVLKTQFMDTQAARKFNNYYWIVILSIVESSANSPATAPVIAENCVIPYANAGVPYAGDRAIEELSLSAAHAYGTGSSRISEPFDAANGSRFVSPVFQNTSTLGSVSSNMTKTPLSGRPNLTNTGATPTTTALAVVAHHIDGSQPHILNSSMGVFRSSADGRFVWDSQSHSGYMKHFEATSLSNRNSIAQPSPYGIIEPISALQPTESTGTAVGVIYSEQGLNQGLTFTQVKLQARSCLAGLFAAKGHTLPSAFVLN